MVKKIQKDKILLILDIDETLIHATSKELDIPFDFMVFKYFVYMRPSLSTFLDYAFSNFNVAFWSSASDDYVFEIVENIVREEQKPVFVWGRSRCTPKRNDLTGNYDYYSDNGFSHYQYTKQLKKIKRQGFTLEKTLMVDDTPSKVANSYGNAIYIKEFNGDKEDRELILLMNYLETLKNCQNVRTFEKRLWNKLSEQ
jgi:carboxy-terminal domain RNA polymerase II polypeptide A small phosphatase